ncbi:tetratricopeptide repeat protein 38-like isoform X1 [Erpetoichthys calabaricus]|uniref:Tetratricopeptide repeat protein 38 n=2 Tax=Erpetoichthys calabaricus TaxID=27687 RepID=A0A8C4SKK7_ERPCA|nr:tetratricopeptide repeat protein 38-like isoform X1 [Erpetoichthys calabaricus]
MPFPYAFRDCKAWESDGLTLSTTSNEACKLYDAALTQSIAWYKDETIGGLPDCLSKMLKEDPDFVMGHVLANGLELMGTARSALKDKSFSATFDNIVQLSKKQTITEREQLHVSALDFFAKGSFPKACSIWEKILVDYPTDLMALRFAYVAYFCMGYQPQLRDCVARVLPHWGPHSPLYGYLKGMHGFGLVETNFYDRAEKEAKEALALNPGDAWSVHCMAHVHEMRSDIDKGIKFMEETENNWKNCDVIACHNYWHWALYLIDKGDYEAALKIYDDKIYPGCLSFGAILDYTDSSSFLCRMEMEGVEVADRWKDVSRLTKKHVEDHVLLFNDFHFLLAALRGKDDESATLLMNTLEECVKSPGENHNYTLGKELGIPLCKAVIEYESGNYSKAVELLHPIRYQIVLIGGSNAQRDVLNQYLIHAAMKSDNKSHKKLARCLLLEQENLKPKSCLIQRLKKKADDQLAN